jgi:hypothetical protein
MQLENTTPFDANLTVSLDRAGHECVVLPVKATFGLPAETGGAAELAPEQLPLRTADEFGPDPAFDAPRFENDFAPFKPRCDVLVHGRAFAPRQEPATSVAVGVLVGECSKRLAVHGSRIWLKGANGHRISDRRRFLTQDIGYDHAFGGTDPEPDDPSRAATYEENPVGVGYYPNRTELEGLPLPNTAEFGRVVDDRRGPHRPMALGPLGRNWLPRRRYAGTYDDAWQQRRMPFLPDDFDSQYFQAAAPDQQIACPRGGERIELVNLSPDGRISTTLPRLQVTVTFERKSGRFTQKVALLDTLLLLPEERRMCLTFRSHLVTERDMFEVARLIVRVDGLTGGAGGA